MAVSNNVHDALNKVFGATGPIGAVYYTAGASVGAVFALWDAYVTFVYSAPVFGYIAKTVLGPKENYTSGGTAAEPQPFVEDAPLVSKRQPVAPPAVQAVAPSPAAPSGNFDGLNTATPTGPATPAEAPASPLAPVPAEEPFVAALPTPAPAVQQTTYADAVILPTTPAVPETPAATEASRAAEKLGSGKAGVVHVTAVMGESSDKPEDEIAENGSVGSEMTASSYMTTNTVDPSTGEANP